MTSLKPGVDLVGIRPEMAIALLIAHDVYAEHGAQLVVTSAMDGRHMQGSLHGRGLALDLRLPSRTSTEQGVDLAVTADLTVRLGGQFDVVLEGDHIHVEHDPREATH